MLCVRRRCIAGCLILVQCLVIAAQGPGPGPAKNRSPMIPGDTQMQSRAVDTRIQLDVLEGQQRGTIVGAIPIKPGFTYRFNEPPREFTLNSSTGEIRSTVILDREQLINDRFDLVVLSSQPTYPIEVRIVVVDVNDNAPEFPEPSISVSFSESAAAGTRLLLDAATDKDNGVNGVSDDYRIVAGNTNDKFKLEVTENPSKEITYLHLVTTGKLDRETQAIYQLNISARDGGTPVRYGYLQVNVTILDVNDNPPIFDHSDYSVSLNESVPPGTKALQVLATDSDIGDNAKITYYLSENERKFTVDPDSGEIFTSEKLDCPYQNCPQISQQKSGSGCPKSCVFTVFARDHGSPRQDGRTYVTVNLVDANDHNPVIKFRYFPPTAGLATVDENAMNGSVVAAVSVVDPDEGPNGETKVEIRSGNEMNHFRLESTQSFDIVRVNGVLDREHINKYNLTIVATDKGSPPRTATAFLIIHVNDVNDHEPVFEKSEYSVILSELSPPGTYVAGIKAADEDSGVNAQIFYSFVSGNDQQWFDIDMHTGLVVTKKSLDREKQGTVELKVSARDGGPNPKWSFTQLKVMILDENDEKPHFSQENLNISFSENTPANTLIAMLTASDHDQGTNGSVTYSLLPEVEQQYPDMFSLDSLTGQLTTRSKLDREQVSSYEIRVVAKDQGIPPQSSTATVSLNVLDVNDNSPEFYPLLYVVRVQENTEVGTNLLRVLATDKDEGENAALKYSIESGGEGIFQIDEKTGNISLRASLRKSSKVIYTLRISAKDRGDKKSVEEAIVEIMKDEQVENLEFDNYAGYAFQITEDQPNERFVSPGREVGRVKVRPDLQHKTEHLRYKIVYGDPKLNFAIDERTGMIRTANLIDRESIPSYSLNVIARAGLMYGKTSVNVTVLDVNDNEPVFMQKKDKIRIPENAAVGQEVFLARAKDKDAGMNSRVTYSLSSDPTDQFRIFEATGVVYLNRPIHAEAGTVLHFEITATDSGAVEPLSSKQSVSVIIEDVNDHTPVFDHTSYETSLLESTPVNDRFFALAASDADLGENAKISYTISEGNSEGKFGVFPDGFMYVKSELDRETRDYYSLVVTATDQGKPPRSSIVPVVIHVIDENDNRPEFTNSTFNFRIKENEAPDSFVGKLTASDMDIGRNAELTFSLSDPKNDFVIDPRNGFIKTLHVFDRESLIQTTGQNFVSFEAVVSDNGLTRLRDKVRVNVYITDVNDNAPQFLRQPYKVQLSEGSSIGTQVVRVFTTDLDEGLNGDVFYLLSKGNEAECFAVDEATGQLSVVKMLDRETTSRFILQVIAHDAALNGQQLSSTATIVVDILDENDNAPEFTETDSRISVPENTPVGSKLIQFQAADADLGVNSEIVFSIGSGNRRDTFHIDPNSGTLFLHKKLDYEEITSYILNITASDGGNPRLSTTIMFTVAVEDCNDNAPAFPNTAFVRQITENIPINTPITAATAEDPDSGINGKITYAITKQEPEDIHHPGKFHFGINPKTGVIHTLLSIDRELVDTFRLTVLATDQAIPESTRLSAEKLVTVIVVDVNDNAPSFVSMNAAVLPSGMTNDKMLVMNVLARDPDSSTNGLVTYDLVNGNTDIFRLDRTTGAVTLRGLIQHPEPRYQISVKATDEAVQSDRKSTDAYITVFAVNSKNGPVFENEELSANVYENQPPGTSVLTVRAEQKDNKFSQIEYYITNVTGQGGRQVDRFFDVDTKLGIISTADVLDREAGSDWYIVEIYAIVANARQPQTGKTKMRTRQGTTLKYTAHTGRSAFIISLLPKHKENDLPKKTKGKNSVRRNLMNYLDSKSDLDDEQRSLMETGENLTNTKNDTSKHNSKKNDARKISVSDSESDLDDEQRQLVDTASPLIGTDFTEKTEPVQAHNYESASVKTYSRRSKRKEDPPAIVINVPARSSNECSADASLYSIFDFQDEESKTENGEEEAGSQTIINNTNGTSTVSNGKDIQIDVDYEEFPQYSNECSTLEVARDILNFEPLLMENPEFSEKNEGGLIISDSEFHLAKATSCDQPITSANIVDSVQGNKTAERESQEVSVHGEGVEHNSLCSVSEGEIASGSNEQDPIIHLSYVNSTSTVKVYDKKYACLFCFKQFSKLPQHLEVAHKNEKEVQEYMAFPKNSADRGNLIRKIRNNGNYIHNYKVLEKNHGTLLVCRRPTFLSSALSFLPCQFCRGFYLRTLLWKHCKTCPDRNEEFLPSNSKVQANSMLLLPCAKNTTERVKSTILKGMTQDPIYAIISNDETLMDFANRKAEKYTNMEQMKFEIRQKLRIVGRLINHLKDKYKSGFNSVAQLTSPANFYKVRDAVRELFLVGNNPSPSSAIKVGHYLKACAKIQISNAIVHSNRKLKESLQEFLFLYEADWPDLIAFNAREILISKKFNKKASLPLAEDVLKFNRLILITEKEAIAKDFKNINYRSLSENTLAHIIAFNRRRPGETERLLISDFNNREINSAPQGEVENILSKMEKKNASQLTRIELWGKKRRKVAIMLTPDMVKCVDHLIKERENNQVKKDNPYVFAIPRCNTSIRGYDAVRKIAHKCGAKQPLDLTSTKFRKHISTLTQLLNLKANELQMVADYLGHNIRIHEEYYRMPEEMLQKSQVSKLLLALEQGIIGEFKGKSLNEINPELTSSGPAQGSDNSNSGSDSSDEGETEDQQPTENLRESVEGETVRPKIAKPLKELTKRIKRKATEIASDSDSDYEPAPSPIAKCKTKKKIKREYLSDEDKCLLRKEFSTNIIRGKVPGKEDCVLFQKKFDQMKKYSWEKIKWGVYNIIAAEKRERTKLK